MLKWVLSNSKFKLLFAHQQLNAYKTTNKQKQTDIFINLEIHLLVPVVPGEWLV